MSTAKTIVITGATRGLGRALVDRFVALGHRVAGCGRDAEAVARLKSQFGPLHAFTAVDVVDASAVTAWATKVMDQFGAPDFLINNAALINRTAPLWTLTAAEVDPVFDVNIKGVVNTIRAFVPAMIQSGRGVVVNLSSGWGRSVSADVAPYCATKWAIEGLTKALAEELPEGLAAVPLNPGIIDTDMLRSCFAASARQYPSPEEWSHRAAPFILQLGRRHNGQSLSVPG